MSRFQLDNVMTLASFLLALTVSLPGDAVGGRKADLTSTRLNSSVSMDPTVRRFHIWVKKMSVAGSQVSLVTLRSVMKRPRGGPPIEAELTAAAWRMWRGHYSSDVYKFALFKMAVSPSCGRQEY